MNKIVVFLVVVVGGIIFYYYTRAKAAVAGFTPLPASGRVAAMQPITGVTENKVAAIQSSFDMAAAVRGYQAKGLSLQLSQMYAQNDLLNDMWNASTQKTQSQALYLQMSLLQNQISQAELAAEYAGSAAVGSDTYKASMAKYQAEQTKLMTAIADTQAGALLLGDLSVDEKFDLVAQLQKSGMSQEAAMNEVFGASTLEKLTPVSQIISPTKAATPTATPSAAEQQAQYQQVVSQQKPGEVLAWSADKGYYTTAPDQLPSSYFEM